MFSFGATATASKPATAPSTPTTGFSFGQPAASTPGTTATALGSFGGTTQNAAQTTAASTFSSGFSAQSQATVSAPAQPTAPISSFAAHPFQYIQQCYDPSNLNYRFRTYFYNAVPGGTTKYPTTKPANISERLWTQIVNDNPDPQNSIPIIANGFEDLKQRAAWQDEQMAAQSAKVKELEERLVTLLKKADLDTTSQLQQIQKQQLQLVKRVLNIMKTFEMSRRAGHRLQPNEEALKHRIGGLLTKLTAQAPIDNNSMRSTQFQLQALQDIDRLDVLQPLRHLSFEDPTAVESIAHILAEQQKGIKALTETLIKDAKDLEIMRYGFQL
jgi:hypothetical protein